MPDIAVQAQVDLREAELFRAEENPDRDNLKDLIDRLDRDAHIAAKLGKIDLKIRLIEEKEKLMELLFA